VLDLPRVLAARPWAADGEVVLEVEDPQGYAAGRWLVRTRDGVAEVSATDRAAELVTDAETLGSLSLSGVRAMTLHGAGRLVGSVGTAGRFAAMADLLDEPCNIIGF
jgi:predicted acetyltransferase